MSLRIAAVLIFAFAGVARAADDPAGLDIYFIDVQGGAATLVVTPERESILLDSGWPGFDDRDPKRIAFVLKEVAGLDHLDHLVTTHWHVDHFGGVEGLAKRMEIKHFWDRGLPEDNLAGVDFPDGPKADDSLGIAYRKASAGKRTVLDPADTLPLKGDVTATVLVSGMRLGEATLGQGDNSCCASAPPDRPVDASDNGRSVGLIFRYKGFDFLDLGDLTWNIEKSLVCPVDRIGPIDLYQVTHHGMDISNHPTLVAMVAPTVAVMNNGPRKGGAPAAVRLLKQAPSIRAFYALHKNQDTGPEDNADPTLTANADPEGGQFVHVRVAPDGKSYTVRIGVSGEPRTFETK